MKPGNIAGRRPGRWLVLALIAGVVAAPALSSAVGFWTPLANQAPNGVELLLLLTDGTVMAQKQGDSVWYKLTPDIHGSYVNGTWSTLASMHDTRLFYSSVVLRDGRLFVAGGEYGTGRATAEVYDPIANVWTYVNPPTSLLDPTQNSPALANGKQGFIDSGAILLENGNVLIAPVGPNAYGGTLIYNPYANSWSAGPTLYRGAYQDEASWVRLPDDSILTIDPYGTSSERYIPASNTWINDGTVPTTMYGSPGGELGPAFMLADGRAFFLGGNGHTAFYTPSGNTTPGFWAAGPTLPAGQAAPDAAGCMMVNGKILCAVSLPLYCCDSGGNNIFPAPTTFYEFDPVANSFAATATPTGGTENIPAYKTLMLQLPDGNVLYSDYGSRLYVYTPDASPLAAGRPAISGLSWNADGSLHLTGSGFNGISQGAAYGDDAQMDSNYPLVRFTDGSGNVYYGRTYSWSSSSVQTGNRVLSTEVAVPVTLPSGFYSLQVVANGNASYGISYYGPIWVDFNYFSSLGFYFGTYIFPYNTIAQGVAGVASGGDIAIKGNGLSHERLTISKPMTIHTVGGPATIGQ